LVNVVGHVNAPCNLTSINKCTTASEAFIRSGCCSSSRKPCAVSAVLKLKHATCARDLCTWRAMDFATGALGSLLPKLAQLLQDEYKLQNGVKKEIEFLCRELETVRAALRNVSEVPLEQLCELVKIWAPDVRELSYDTEDIVDTFLVRVQGPKLPSKKSTKRFIKKMIQKVTKASIRRDIAQEINGHQGAC